MLLLGTNRRGLSQADYIVALDIRQVKFAGEELRDGRLAAASRSNDGPDVAKALWRRSRSRAHIRSGGLLVIMDFK